MMKYGFFTKKFGIQSNYASSYMESRAEAVVRDFPRCHCCNTDSVYYMGFRRLDTAAKVLPARLDIGMCSTCNEVHIPYVGCYKAVVIETLEIFPVELGPLHNLVDPFSCGVRVTHGKEDEGVIVTHDGHPERAVTVAHLTTGRRIRLIF